MVNISAISNRRTSYVVDDLLSLGRRTVIAQQYQEAEKCHGRHVHCQTKILRLDELDIGVLLEKVRHLAGDIDQDEN